MSGSVAVDRPLPPLSIVEPQSRDTDVIVNLILDRVGERFSSRNVYDQTHPYFARRGDEPAGQTAETVEDRLSTESVDIQSNASSRRRETPSQAGSYVEREQPEAGPSTPYRRSLRLGNSTTSFIDVTDSISNISEHPVSGGGFCDVHMADMTGEGKVALKKLRLLGNSEKAKKRFRYEAEIWIRLEHQNVLRFFGICQTGPTLYMVSPWQENGHMTAYFNSHPNADRLHFLTQVADALAFLHSNDPRIIHGDIKGQNVLVSQGGNALLCDFGLSMILTEMAFISGVPTGVQDGGSIRWLAPELMQGSDSKTESSDVFSFALLIVEGITGYPPFPELSIDAAVINAVINGKRPENPFSSIGVDEARLWRLLQLCWHPTVNIRPNMDLVRTVMHSLHAEGELAGTLVELPKAFADFVMLGKLTLGEYTKPQKSGQPVGKANVRWLRRGHSTATNTTQAPSPYHMTIWNRITSPRGLILFVIYLRLLVYVLSASAVALNIVLFSFFHKLSNPIFRHVTPILGFANWAWLLLIMEPLLCLRYLNAILRMPILLSLFQLIPLRAWLICQTFSSLVCTANTVLVIVTSSSVSFANHTKFHKILISYNALSIAMMILAPTNLLITFVVNWRQQHRPVEITLSSPPVITKPSERRGTATEPENRSPRALEGGSEGQHSDLEHSVGASSSIASIAGTADTAPGNHEDRERISEIQRGKQRAV